MGFTKGNLLLGKSNAKKYGMLGYERHADKHVVIEIYGNAHKVASRRFREDSAVAAADHAVGLLEADPGDRQQWTSALIQQVEDSSNAAGIFHSASRNAPLGACYPKTLEYVLEGIFPGKAEERKRRKAARQVAYDSGDRASAAIVPDCAVQAAIDVWHANDILVTTPRAAEADGVMALRVAQGCTLLLQSSDSDIFMYPLGDFAGEIIMPNGGGNHVIIDRSHKAHTMAALMNLPINYVLEHTVKIEAVYLAVGISGGQDYTTWNDCGVLTKKTGIGEDGLRNLLKTAGAMVYASASWPKDAVSSAMQALTTIVSRVVSSEVLARCKQAVLAFLQHPVQVSPWNPDHKPYIEALNLGDDGLGTSGSYPPTVFSNALPYTYYGGCDNCVGVIAPKVWAASDFKIEKSRWQSPYPKNGDGARGNLPWLRTSAVIRICEAYSTKVDYGGFDHDATEMVLNMLDRASNIRDESWRVAILNSNEFPEGRGGRIVDGATTIVVVISVCVSQSYGCKQKEDTTRQGKSNEYPVTLVFEISASSGSVIFGPNFGSKEGWNDSGLIGAGCPCKSPFMLCGHVIGGLVAMSRVSEDSRMSSTSNSKYWNSKRVKRPTPGPPRRIQDCLTKRHYISDCFDEGVPEHELSLMLAFVPSL